MFLYTVQAVLHIYVVCTTIDFIVSACIKVYLSIQNHLPFKLSLYFIGQELKRPAIKNILLTN